MKFLLIACIASITLIYCNNKKSIFLENDIRAEGNILNDSIFQGLIKFYDTRTNKLVSQTEYDKGLENGLSTSFYPNGNISSEMNYKDGKLSGYSKFYDSSSKLSNIQYSYYDLNVGPLISFKDGKPSTFDFYSFDNELLFSLRYDSIGSKRITDLKKDFFFFKKTNVLIDSNAKNEYLIYLVNPPNYHFQYSLCVVNDSFEIIKRLKIFNESNVWEHFDINPTQLRTNHHFVLKLELADSINGRAILFKKLL